MASFITRLLSRFKTNKRSQRNRRAPSRRLRVEAMEARRLLAGDLGAIAGNVFTDLTDNGYDPNNPPAVVGDPGIAGVTVRLFLDNGNGTFGPEDGVAIQTQVTNANGDYRFDGLSSIDDTTPALYFVQQDAAPGRLQRPAQTVQSVTITPAMANGVEATNIDNYDTTPVTTDPAPLTATPSTSVSDQASTAGGEALGGQRDIQVNNTTPIAPGAQNLDVSVVGGLLSISPGPGVTGNVIVSYDGVDASADTLDHTTLGPIDLTANDGEAFHFLVGSEAGNSLTVTVYSGGTNFSEATVPLTVTPGGTATANLFIPFGDLLPAGGAGVDLTAVTAVRFQVDVVAGADAQVNFTRVVGPDVSELNFANLNPMSLGDLVFNDSNNNGVLDAGETGIPGVEVRLFEDTNLNGFYDDGIDTQVGTAQNTDANGNYLFTNLFPGEYLVLIPIAEFGAGQPLVGFQTSTGNDPAPDPDIVVIDGDDNGSLIAGIGVASAAITLAAGTEPTNDGDTDPNSNLTLDFGFAPQIDLEVLKTSDVTTVAAGNQVTYTLTVRNNGAGPASNVVVTDNLPDLAPDALTIVSATATGGGVVTQTGIATGEIEVAYATLNPGQSETVTIVVLVPSAAAAAAVVTNEATVTGDGIETDPNNNTADRDVEITRQAVLTLTKTDTPDPASVGSTLTYEILVTNTGPSTATNVVVTDTLPTGLTFGSVSTTAGTANEVLGVVTVNIPTLAVNASATITVETFILSGFAGSTIPNSASADADEALPVTADASTSINPIVDLQITKTDNVDPVNRGGQLQYTLTVVNNGPSAATNVEIVDTLPSDVTFVSADGGTVTGGTVGTNNPVTISLGSMAAAETRTVTITVNVSASAAATLNNSALVRSTETIAGFDSNIANNTDTETTNTESVIDLAITKADSVDPATPGENLVYTIVVTNNGPSDATQVNVTDNLPDGIRITSANSTVGTVTIPASAQDTTAANPDDLTVNIGNLANGASATITINATVLPGTTGTLTNVATVASSDTSLTENVTTNNTATQTTGLTPEIDLRITKTDSVDPVIAGNALTYTIVVTNDGPSTATNVNLTDTLPAGVTFTSASSSQGTVTNNAGVVTGNLGTLAPNASATVTLVVGVNAATRGTITNTASVQAAEAETTTTNNSASQQTTVNGNIDLAITKVDSVDPVTAGGALAYTIVVTNNGPSTATNVVVTDTLPSTLTPGTSSSTVGTVTTAGNTVTANVGTLASGASATITINTTVATTATGSITNTASVTATETDTNPANNSATQGTQLVVPGSISGFVYLDVNQNGVRDTGDTPISGVLITLTGTETTGAPVSRTTTTDATGAYTFNNLLPGTYQLVQTQPAGLRDGQVNVGTGATGTPGTNQITAIVLTSGANAEAFNFGELRPALSKRLFLASTTT
jgi:uncharacterized repeat protein (TIGR01451 family)